MTHLRRLAIRVRTLWIILFLAAIVVCAGNTQTLPASTPAKAARAKAPGTGPNAPERSEENNQTPSASGSPHEPGEDDLQAEDVAYSDSEIGPEGSSAEQAQAQGDAIRRQVASVQRQLGRTRPQGGGFFVSSWFSDDPSDFASAPPTSRISAAYSPDTEDCDPLDQSIAEAYIRDSAKSQGVSTDLVREVIRQESGFRPCALSEKGAMGMMQLMPETASTLGVDDPFDARENIDGGVRLLKRLLEKYKGRPDLALAAYNAGEGAVDANNGIPNFEETRKYVTSIMKRVFEAPAKKDPSQSAVIPPVPVRITAPQAP